MKLLDAAVTVHLYDVELQRIVEAWPKLSIEARRAISLLVNTIAPK